MSQNRKETEKSNIDPSSIMTEESKTNDNIETDSKTNHGIDVNKNKNIPFNDDINKIYKHIKDKTMTKEIFESFWNKVTNKLTHYQQKLEKLEKIANKFGKKLKSPSPAYPEIDVEKLIADNISSQVVAFENIEGRSPRIKELFIEFYPQFLTFVPQKMRNKTNIKQ